MRFSNIDEVNKAVKLRDTAASLLSYKDLRLGSSGVSVAISAHAGDGFGPFYHDLRVALKKLYCEQTAKLKQLGVEDVPVVSEYLEC